MLTKGHTHATHWYDFLFVRARAYYRLTQIYFESNQTNKMKNHHKSDKKEPNHDIIHNSRYETNILRVISFVLSNLPMFITRFAFFSRFTFTSEVWLNVRNKKSMFNVYNKNGTKQKNQQNIWTNKRKIIVVIFFRFFTIRDTKKLSSSLLFFPYRFRNGKNTNNTYIQLTGNASVPRCVNTIVNEKNVKRTDEMVKWKQISPFAINIPAHKSHSSAGFTHTFCATHLYNENAQTSTTQHHLSSCFAIICRGDLQLNLASFNRQRCFFFCRLTSIVSKFNSNEKHRIYSI